MPRPLILACLALLVLAAGCVSHPADTSQTKPFIVLNERTYDVPFEHMYTLARRTERDLRLTEKTFSKNSSLAYLVFDAPAADFAEMTMQIQDVDGRLTRVTVFGHDHEADLAAEDILKNLADQVAIDKDPEHKLHK